MQATMTHPSAKTPQGLLIFNTHAHLSKRKKKRKTVNFKSHRTKKWWKGLAICLYIDLSPPQTAKTKIVLWCCKSKVSICKQLIKNTK